MVREGARWGRWAAALAAVGVFCGLLVGSWVVIGNLRSDAEAASDQALLAVRSDALLSQTESVENAQFRRLVPTADPVLLSLLARVSHDAQSLNSPQVGEVLDRYAAAAREAVRLLVSGRTAAARRIEQSEQNPAADALITAEASVAADRDAHASSVLAHANRVSLAVHVGTVVVLAGVMLLMWFIDARAERARRRLVEFHEARFRGIVSRGSDAILLLDELGAVLFASDSSLQVLGSGPEKLEGASLLDCFEGDDRSRVGAAVDSVVSNPARVAVLSLAVENSELRFLELTLASRISDRTIGAIVANVRDITERRLIEAALGRSEALLSDLLEHSPVPIYVKDLEGKYLRVNRALEELLGREQHEVVGLTSFDLFPSQTAELIVANDRMALERGAYEDEEVLSIRGARRVFLSSRFALIDSAGEPYAIAGVSLDMTDRLRLEDTERLLGTVVSHSGDAMFTVKDGEITAWNPAAEALFGYSSTEVVGRSPELLIPENRADEYVRVRERVARGETVRSLETERRTRDGGVVPVELTLSPLLDSAGGVVGASAIVRDVSERYRHREQLAVMARTDSLTGLADHPAFMDVLAQVINRCTVEGIVAALVYVDVDRFKLINDSFGHPAGDELLRMLAARIGQAVRPEDVVGRVAGEEFAVVCHPVTDAAEAVEIAEGILRKIEAPMRVHGQELAVTASVGVALSPARDPRGWLQDADRAMYEAKRKGRARVEVFDEHLREVVVDRLALRNELRRAVDAEAIIAYYQPIVSMRTGRVIGFEALARWPHPRRGLVPPGEFIAIAEDCGLIGKLGLQIARIAVERLAGWQREFGDDQLEMSFNVSVAQLSDEHFPQALAEIVTSTGVDPGCLVAEVTESAFASEVVVGPRLREIAGLGVRLAIDDFGTGYSSLAYLSQFPVSRLKIDRVFIQRLSTDQGAHVLIGAIAALAHELNLSVTAEGIETVEAAGTVLNLGCDHGQGFLWGAPLPEERIEGLKAKDVTASVDTGPVTPLTPETLAYLRAAHLQVSGTSPHTIAAVLNREGMSRSDGRRWSPTAVTKLLSKPEASSAHQ